MGCVYVVTGVRGQGDWALQPCRSMSRTNEMADVPGLAE